MDCHLATDIFLERKECELWSRSILHSLALSLRMRPRCQKSPKVSKYHQRRKFQTLVNTVWLKLCCIKMSAIFYLFHRVPGLTDRQTARERERAQWCVAARILSLEVLEVVWTWHLSFHPDFGGGANTQMCVRLYVCVCLPRVWAPALGRHTASLWRADLQKELAHPLCSHWAQRSVQSDGVDTMCLRLRLQADAVVPPSNAEADTSHQSRFDARLNPLPAPYIHNKPRSLCLMSQAQSREPFSCRVMKVERN